MRRLGDGLDHPLRDEVRRRATFFATSLRSVTVRVKEHHKCRVIVAADNDRWNDFYRGRLDSALAPNPGVHFAR